MPKKFYRSHDNKLLAGVCGGIAEYFSLDASVVRLVTAVLIFFFGAGAIIYILLWLFTPDSPKGSIGLDSVFDFYQAHRDRK